MPDPIVAPRPGGWQYTWSAEGVTICLDRLREHRDSITAEISIQDRAGEDIIAGPRVNLQGITAPGLLAKRLTERMNGVSWSLLLETAFQATLRRFRQGSPVVEIGGLPLRKTPRWRVEPFILEGLTTMIFGEGGVGKSTFAVLLALCVSQGWGESLGLKVTKGKVLFLDWETTQDDINETAMAMEAGLKLPEPPRILYRACRRPLLADTEEVDTIVKTEAVDFIIVDSAIPAVGGEKLAKEDASPMMDFLHGLGKSVLLLSHEPKDEMIKRKRPYGSVMFENRARAMWQARGEQGEGGVLQLGLFLRKRNLTGPLPPRGYTIHFGLGGITVTPQDVKRVPELREGLAIQERIKAVLTHAMTAEEIAAETGESLDAIRVCLSRYKDKSFINLNPGKKPALWGNLALEESIP